jgi:putative peptidoglycan binding protein/D-alanyl-D-alanine carboxypeptidase-like protein
MSITDRIPVPGTINAGVNSAKQTTMLSLLGNPRDSYTDDCQPVTNPNLSGLVVVESVGPFRAQGLRPAIASLRQVLQDVAQTHADIHAALGTAGMLCARLVRGSAHSISNHSWGTAIDLTVAGVLDRRGDGFVLRALADIAPIFNHHGWFWGAGFATEDAMHFEASDDLIRQWHIDGLVGRGAPPPPVLLTVGDRGPEVRVLQTRLNERGAALTVDGVFGTGTRAAVAAFQVAHGLRGDGVVGPKTRDALGLA